MTKILFTLFILLIVCALVAQNVGINNVDPQATLDINGDLRLRSHNLSLTGFYQHDFDISDNKFSNYTINPTATAGCIITGLTGGIDGRIASFFNTSTAFALQFYPENLSLTSQSSEINRIISALGQPIVVSPNGCISFKYDGLKQRWVVINGAGVEGINYQTGAGGWSINGNSGTDTITNFIGTIDNKSLLFRVNNLPFGKLGSEGSIAFGKNALIEKPSIIANQIAIGDSVLAKIKDTYTYGQNIYGYYNPINLAIGQYSLARAKRANGTITIGNHSLGADTATVSNIAIGDHAMYNFTNNLNTDLNGNFNIAIGNWSLIDRRGDNNIAIGHQSGNNNNQVVSSSISIGNYSKAGTNSLALQGTAKNNSIAIGGHAQNSAIAIGGNSDSTGISLGLGSKANLHSISIGVSSLSNSANSRNIAIGNNSLQLNNVGQYNTTVGFESLFNALGNHNSSIGDWSGVSLSVGDNNTFIGSESGRFFYTGNNNIFIGSSAGKNIINGGNNIFIGTSPSTPQNDVYNKIKIGGVNGKMGIGLGNDELPLQTLSVGNGGIKIKGSEPSYDSFIAANETGDNSGSTRIRSGALLGQIYIGDLPCAGVNIGTGNLTRTVIGKDDFLQIDGTNKTIGINISNPNSTFAVKKTSSVYNNEGSFTTEGTTYKSHFHYSASEDTYIRGGKANSSVYINDSGIGNVYIAPSNSSILGLNSGKVGIGRVPTIYKLEVNGTIKSNEIIVESTWADYVFEKNYKLKSIEELDSYIKEHKHLPNVPPASDIENNGLKIGETNKAMMEKIEELTLYIIQLKKEIDQLKNSKK
jgi:hypothetical protein